MAFQRHANLKGLQRGALRKQNKNRLGRALAAVVRSELSRVGFVCSSCFILVFIVGIKEFLQSSRRFCCVFAAPPPQPRHQTAFAHVKQSQLALWPAHRRTALWPSLPCALTVCIELS